MPHSAQAWVLRSVAWALLRAAQQGPRHVEEQAPLRAALRATRQVEDQAPRRAALRATRQVEE